MICSQRLAGLLLRYLTDTGVRVETEQVRRLRASAFAWASRSVQALDAAYGAIKQLEDVGIQPFISKGPGIARTYPTRECRPFSDVDLVISRPDFVRATALLEASGWSEEDRNRQPWNYFRTVCREGLNLRGKDGGNVDLHHRFPPWLWAASIDTSAVATRSTTVEIANRKYRCASHVDNLLIAALHVISDRNEPGRTLLIWRDLLELARVVPTKDIVEVAQAAELSGWLRSVLAALPPVVRPDDLIASLPDDRLKHPARVWLLLSKRAATTGVLVSQFLRLPLPNGFAFVCGIFVPSPSFLRRKYPGRAHAYLRWWSNVGGHFNRDGVVS